MCDSPASYLLLFMEISDHACITDNPIGIDDTCFALQSFVGLFVTTYKTGVRMARLNELIFADLSSCDPLHLLYNKENKSNPDEKYTATSGGNTNNHLIPEQKV